MKFLFLTLMVFFQTGSLFAFTSSSSSRMIRDSGDSGYSSSGGGGFFGGGGGLQSRLASSASCGSGRGAGDYACYRAVKKIVADALGKDVSCVRGFLSGGSAFQAVSDLQKLGFVDDRSQCKTPGVVRVYKGAATGMGSGARGFMKSKYGTRLSPGDTHGHTEVLGNDGLYHSYYSTSEPIDETMPGRRILIGCMVPGSQTEQIVSRCSSSSRTCGSGKFGPNPNKGQGGTQ